MFNEIAVMMIMMWPAIPMFFIELHLAINFWRRLGLWTYLVIALEWLPIGLVLYLLQEQLLFYMVAPSLPFVVLGTIVILAGLSLHAWTVKLIGLKATIGYTELKPDKQAKNQTLVMSGPFAVVRHPSYWGHTAILAGVFLITGAVVLGIIAVIDLAITYFIVTTLEDKELVDRFGEKYIEYQKRVPKLFPKVTNLKGDSAAN